MVFRLNPHIICSFMFLQFFYIAHIISWFIDLTFSNEEVQQDQKDQINLPFYLPAVNSGME